LHKSTSDHVPNLFLFGLNAGLADEDIRKVFRLGQRGVNDQVPRPILVQLGSHTAKTLVMENLYKLKSLPQRFRNISIAHDMKQKERDDCKALVEEAKSRSANDMGEWIYRVRGLPAG